MAAASPVRPQASQPRDPFEVTRRWLTRGGNPSYVKGLKELCVIVTKDKVTNEEKIQRVLELKRTFFNKIMVWISNIKDLCCNRKAYIIRDINKSSKIKQLMQERLRPVVVRAEGGAQHAEPSVAPTDLTDPDSRGSSPHTRYCYQPPRSEPRAVPAGHGVVRDSVDSLGSVDSQSGVRSAYISNESRNRSTWDRLLGEAEQKEKGFSRYLRRLEGDVQWDIPHKEFKRHVAGLDAARNASNARHHQFIESYVLNLYGVIWKDLGLSYVEQLTELPKDVSKLDKNREFVSFCLKQMGISKEGHELDQILQKLIEPIGHWDHAKTELDRIAGLTRSLSAADPEARKRAMSNLERYRQEIITVFSRLREGVLGACAAAVAPAHTLATIQQDQASLSAMGQEIATTGGLGQTSLFGWVVPVISAHKNSQQKAGAQSTQKQKAAVIQAARLRLH